VTEEPVLGNPLLFRIVSGQPSLGMKWNKHTNKEHVGFEVIKAVVMNTSVF
jgi:hypothetical protein